MVPQTRHKITAALSDRRYHVCITSRVTKYRENTRSMLACWKVFDALSMCRLKEQEWWHLKCLPHWVCISGVFVTGVSHAFRNNYDRCAYLVSARGWLRRFTATMTNVSRFKTAQFFVTVSTRTRNLSFVLKKCAASWLRKLASRRRLLTIAVFNKYANTCTKI